MAEFSSLLRLISNGEPVDQATINSRLSQLHADSRYLLSLINALTAGQAIFALGVESEVDVELGQAVFFNTASRRFERALAVATVVDGVLTTAESARCWGVCHKKHSATKIDVLLGGYATLDISAALASDETIGAGLYFLSGGLPGGLTRTEPPIGVPVLFRTADGQVNVNVSFADIYVAHQHYKVPLVCAPAGDVSLVGDYWEFSAEDDEVEGWLPADNAIFDGLAPAGAVLGYNLSASSLRNAWPPTPISGAVIEWNRNVNDFVGFTGVPPNFVQIDENGIWWMSSCEEHSPWPANYTGTTSPPVTTPAPLCPPPGEMAMNLYYTRAKFQTSRNVVTSLRSASPALLIRCLNTQSGSGMVGDLQIDLDLDLSVDDADDAAGNLVFKTLSASGVFSRGPVVEKIKAAAANVTLASTGGADGSGYHRGSLTIGVLQNVVGGQLPIDTVRLIGAEQENYNDTLSVSLPEDRDSSYRATLTVPADVGADSVTLRLVFWFLAREAGDLPDLTLSYRAIEPVDTPTALPTSDDSLVLTMTPGAGMLADQYVEIRSAEFTVAAGSQVLFTLAREADDGYASDVQVINQFGLITALVS